MPVQFFGAALAGFLLAVVPVAAQVALDPPDWNIGRMEMDRPVTRTVAVKNTGSQPMVVTFVSTCPCLEAAPSRLDVAAGATSSVVMRYAPEEPGRISVYFVVRAVAPGASGGTSWTYSVKGHADAPSIPRAAAPAADPQPPPATQAPAAAQLRLYYAPGCRSCERLIARIEARLAAQPAGTATLVRRNVLEPEAFEELAAAAGPQGTPLLPALVAGGRVLAGEEAIEAGLEGALAGSGSAGSALSGRASGGAEAIARRLAAPALFAAGLVDGINPCAFTTIIFLLTSLVLAGRRRGEVLLVGIGFTVAVFGTYLLVGLGFFHSLRAASTFPLVASTLRWVLAVVLILFAALSLYDYALARRGRAAEMVLRLPDPIKRRMQRTILSGARSTALVGGSLALGAAVSLFELACTGQVYLPAVAWLVRTEGGAAAYLLLVVYNLGFILPLAVVFVLAWRGVSSRRLTAYAQAHLGGVKLALAVVFAGLAALTLAT